ncbi:transmembrane protein, putative (macronuclear) [Tetrahymena thermophila SB210]|uniref:Transmembrane protein, putative n=1 Tax=Tetrahymena thermophila (strain SB210) TaxID=312017 RepID=I7MDQ8_TETTS|nr:transmembrane protein, putative [Tetrahymena thermophila SB210]EAR90771.2 transmembrane protein, putative [Tetrahymena thermophila SB210]|eukprot:XP_001011016.2 transmembrane protein, putative [Tetrahymena thermophila SB210]
MIRLFQCQPIQRNPGASGFSLKITFVTFNPPQNAKFLTLQLSDLLGINFSSITKISYQAVNNDQFCKLDKTTSINAVFDSTQKKISIPNPFTILDTNSQMPCSGQNVPPNWLTIQIVSTFQYGGTINIQTFYDSVQYGTTNSIGLSTPLQVQPDNILDANIQFGFSSTTPSKIISDIGEYSLKVTTPTLTTAINQIALTLPMYWYPDTLLPDSGCQQTSVPQQASFKSTLLSSLSATVTTDNPNGLYKVALSFTQINLNGQIVDLTFQMTNPFTSANIVLEGTQLIIIAAFNYQQSPSSTVYTAFQTQFSNTNVQASSKTFPDCNQNGNVQILCSPTSNGSYTNQACMSGQTVFVKILMYPIFFQDIYSSVQFTLSNLPPNQQAITGITMQIQNAGSQADAGVPSNSVSTNNQVIFFNQYLNGNVNYQSYPFICMAGIYIQWLSIIIPSFQLPYDIDGLNISAQFFVQPFLPLAGYSQYKRDLVSDKILNTQCSNTKIQINQNTLKAAQVTTSNQNDLQVGATSATHEFTIKSQFSFLSTSGKIQLTLPSSLSINAGGTFSCTLKFILTDNSLLSNPTTCTKAGTPTVVTLSYTYSGTQKAIGFVFTINQVKNPTIIQFSKFSVQTFLRNGGLSESNDNSNTFGFTTLPAPFTTAQLVNNAPGVKNVYTLSPYKLTLISPVDLLTTNQIIVNFPNYVLEINNISVTSPSTGITTSSNNQFPLTLTFTQQITANTPINVQFTIRNPPVSNLDYQFQIVAYDVTPDKTFLQSTINYGSTDNIKLVGFSSFGVISSSPQNLATAVFTVSFNPTVLLAKPSIMILTFTAPTNTHNFLITAQTTCSPITPGLTLSCTINTPSTNQLTVTFNTDIQPSTNYQFNIQNVLNYLSTSPYQITGDLGYSQNQVGNESSQTIQNTQFQSLSTVQLVITNSQLGIASQYQFNIQTVSPFPQNGNIVVTATDLVQFVLPSSVTVNLSTCTGSAGDTTSKLTLSSCYPNQDPSLITMSVNNPNQLIQNSNTPFTITLNEIVGGTLYPIKQYTSPNLVYKNKCNVSSFCKTCQDANPSSCLTCYPQNTIYYQSQNVYVQEIILNSVPAVPNCVASCPAQSYQTTQSGQSICASCSPPCTACMNSSTFCTSCSGNLYLDPTINTCSANCPNLYFQGSNNKCQLCSTVGNCLTCSSAGVCTSCDPNFYKKQNTQCVTQCDSSYYLANGGTECKPCPTGCNTCTSDTNCTACSVGYIKYQTTCVSSCPSGYSRLMQGGVYVCGLCDPNCQACDTISTTCTSCYPNTYLYNQKCITQSQIPAGNFGDNATWTVQPCMNYCVACSYKSLCTTCSQSAVVYQGVCYTTCPSSAPVPDGAGGCKQAIVPAAVSDNSSKVVPFPMLLSCIAFCISVYFSKYEKPQTFVPGCIVGFCALFEWISWIILIAICYLNDGIMSITTIAAAVGFVLIYLFNLVYYILYRKTISKDTSFMEWELSHKNRMCKNVSIFFSCLISFKIQKIIFCKYFNQNFFKAKLKDIDLLSPFNKVSVLSVIFNSFLIILSAAIFSYKYQNSTQIYILSLDTLLVTIFMIIFMIWEALKNETFFEENYNMNFEQMSQFTQRFFPFDQSYMERARQRSVYGHLKKSESNSSLTEFGKDNKVTKVEQLQQPYSQVMDPNDISTNAAIDRNVLNNSNNGAPYLIQDELSESSKPGKKRQFEKKHVAPVFDHKNFPPIEENSLEDEDEDYYDEDYQNQTMKKMVGASNMAGLANSKGFDKNKMISLDDQEDLENQRNKNLNNSNQFQNSNGFNKNNGSDQVPSQLNQSHTVYYDPQDPSGQMMNNVSMGVGLQEDENDGEGEEVRQRLFSKQSGDENMKEKAALIAGTSLIGGAVVGAAAAQSANNKNEQQQLVDQNGNRIDKDGNLIDKDGNKIDKEGNRIDKNGNKIDKDGNMIDKDGYIIDKEGNKIDKDGNKIDKDGNKIDKDGNKIDKDGNRIDKDGNKIDKDGNRIDKDGNRIDKDGNRIDKDGNRIDKDGHRIDKDGNRIDKDGNRIDKDGNKIDKNGNRIDKDGNRIDKDGNIIDKDGNRIDKDGNRIDKDGNRIDKDGNRIDKDGNRIDKDGNRIDKDGHRIDKDGNKIDKDGNRIDKDGNRIDKDGNRIDKDGNRIDKDGNRIDKDGNRIDKDGNRIDKNGNRIDKDGNRIDKDGNRIDKNGNRIDKDGNRIDKDGNRIDKDGNRIDKDGNRIDKDGNRIDKDGNKIDKDGNRIDKDGNRIDKDGNRIDKDGNRIDKDGNRIDKDGNRIDKDGHRIDKDGNRIDKDGNRIDKDGNRIDKDGNRIDKDGNRIDKNGNKLDKNGKVLDDKNKKAEDDMLFYFNNPLNDQNEQNKNNQKEGQQDKTKKAQNLDENKVEKIMPEVEDLDEDLSKKDKNQNEMGKNKKMITPNDIVKGNNKNQKGPQKNNLFGTSDDEGANQNSKKKKGQSEKKNNIYDSDESLHTASEAEMNFNEISPTDFNILNQRYEEDYFVQPPQSALQMQLLQQSLSQLNRNISSSQSQAFMNNTGFDGNNTRQSQPQAGQFTTGVGNSQGFDKKMVNQFGQNNIDGSSKLQQNQQKQKTLQPSNSNLSMNSQNPQNGMNKSNSPVKRQKQVGLNNSRSQNVNALSVDIKQNTQPNIQGQSNNLSTINSNNNGNINPILANPNANGNTTDQLLIENFDDFNNNTSSQTAIPQGFYQNQFNSSFNNQDPRMSYTQMNRGNLSSRSKGNSPSSQNIAYKVPAVDVNKLKNLEKIYLQRIEANVNSSQSSRKNALKKKKKKIQRELSHTSNLQVNPTQGMKSPGDMSEIYFGERGQKFDPTMLDHNGEEVIDFDDEEDVGPENVNFDQNF